MSRTSNRVPQHILGHPEGTPTLPEPLRGSPDPSLTPEVSPDPSQTSPRVFRPVPDIPEVLLTIQVHPEGPPTHH